MEIILAFPLLVIGAVLQTALINRLTLLNGSADIILIIIIAWSLQDRIRYGWFWAILAGMIMTYISALPAPVFLVGYLGATTIARAFQNRIWQAPLLAMMLVTLASSFGILGAELIILQITSVNLPLIQSLTRIILPSILLNLFFSAPIYILMRDLANWIYPQTRE